MTETELYVNLYELSNKLRGDTASIENRQKFYASFPAVGTIIEKYDFNIVQSFWSEQDKSYVLVLSQGDDQKINGRMLIKEDGFAIDFASKNVTFNGDSNKVRSQIRVSGNDICGVLNNVISEDEVVTTEFLFKGIKTEDEILEYKDEKAADKLNTVFYFHEQKLGSMSPKRK